MARYARVVVKISGEAFAGASGLGSDPARPAWLADEITSVHGLGTQIAVVVGGGNYVRGRQAESLGIGRAEADEIGMLGTVMNALMLRGALTSRGAAEVRVMTAVAMQGIAEPFVRLRADRHLSAGRIVLLAGGTGQPYVTADYAAVQRALELSADALLVAKRGVDGVYDSDPRTHPGAKRYAHLTYREAIGRELAVMDTTALVLAGEHGLLIHVFDVAAQGAMAAVCEGRDIGTRLTAE